MSDREVCTRENPMPKNAPGFWAHPDSVFIEDEYNGLCGGGDYEYRHCPNCDLKFRVTLPD